MLLRHSRRFRPGTVTIVLGLTLVVIPYIVDVAFLWDLTPVHFAQENIVESEDLQDIDEKGPGPVLNISDSLLIAQYSRSSAPSDVRVSLAVSPPCPTLILISATPASRPPPICPLS